MVGSVATFICGCRRKKTAKARDTDSEEEAAKVMFLHRRIEHKWVLDEDTQETAWFLGQYHGQLSMLKCLRYAGFERK